MGRPPFDPERLPHRIEPSVAPIPPQVEALAHRVIGAAIEVHRHLGPGFPEAVYENALSIELAERSIAFVRQQSVAVTYKGTPVGHGKMDLFVGDELVVEIKSVDALSPVHEAQTVAYLRATHKPLGLLINFTVRVHKDGIKRIIR